MEAKEMNEQGFRKVTLSDAYHNGMALIGSSGGRMCMVFNGGKINAGTEASGPQRTLGAWVDNWSVRKQRALDACRHM